MSILAGIFSRTGVLPIDDSVCESMQRLISRNPNDEVVTFRDQRCFFAKVDIGAYQARAFRTGPLGSVAMLVGEPLLLLDEGDGSARTRTDDLELLHEEWDRGNWDLLRRVRGAFCAGYYDPRRSQLLLIADKLGLRSLYFWEDPYWVIFASALRILEALPQVPKRMDVRAVTEITTLGFPLSVRTPYSDVSLLRAAEIVQFSGEEASHNLYWRWDDVLPSKEPEQQLKEAYRRFQLGIKNRLRGDKAAFSFLSGGLDSRCVVDVLRSLKATVHSLNFSSRGTQDQVFGREFARKVGTIHEEIEIDPEVLEPTGKVLAAASAWNASKHRIAHPVERPMLAWNGDGGSVGVGHVYLSRAVIDLARAEKQDAAIDAFLSQQRASVVRRLLKPDVVDLLSKIPKTGIDEELKGIRCQDAGRAFHLFLMLNDQRRHISYHCENIDRYRLEYQLPFYDSYFLETILASPIDLCLGHGFYVKWLKHFSPAVTSVPWQAYPGHEPCPLPPPPGLAYQWHRGRASATQQKKLVRQAEQILGCTAFPHPIFRQWYLRLATWIHRAGLRDLSYVLEAATTYHRYWVICGGNFIMPVAP